MIDKRQENPEDINVLELRNYLLKPNLADTFSPFFHSTFVAPMTNLGGYTLGEFKIHGVNDRFVWLRGFADMRTRINFLNDFYISSPTWKEHGKRANEMMLNSDNVYLLKPLSKYFTLTTDKLFTVIDFYICNSRLEKVIALFETRYIPFLRNLDVKDISLWISEMTENDFPKLPVFQDKNLLVTITHYKDENEFYSKEKEINRLPDDLKQSMQQLITSQHKLVLVNQNEENIRANLKAKETSI